MAHIVGLDAFGHLDSDSHLFVSDSDVEIVGHKVFVELAFDFAAFSILESFHDLFIVSFSGHCNESLLCDMPSLNRVLSISPCHEPEIKDVAGHLEHVDIEVYLNILHLNKELDTLSSEKTSSDLTVSLIGTPNSA